MRDQETTPNRQTTPEDAAAAGNDAADATDPQDRDAPGFEDALRTLEEIVERLEDGDLSLEQSLTLFEQGVALARLCSGRLDQAERKIEVLVAEHDDVALRPAPELEVEDDADAVS